jgi:hypothetical protein
MQTPLKTRNRYSTASGPKRVPAPRITLDAATFNGVYMRPNIANGGAVPALGNMCTCPDIWIAGTTPVGNFQTALATTASYQAESSSNISVGSDNYIYVRGMNGTSAPQSRSVQLYYSPSAIIQWPGQWQSNVVKTDQGNAIANIANLAAGQVGVADQTFLWPNVQPPPAGSDHYCLFAQFNDVNNDNPFPDIFTQVDMGTLIMNNLAWGWRNVTLVPGMPATWQVEVPLTIPQNLPTAVYALTVTPTGFINWTVWFTCSQADADGNPIALQPETIVQNGAGKVAPACRLAGGFNAIVTLYLQSNGNPASPGANIPLSCNYQTTPTEVEDVVRRGLIDWNLNARLRRALGPGIGPTPWMSLGGITWKPGSSSTNTRSRRHK